VTFKNHRWICEHARLHLRLFQSAFSRGGGGRASAHGAKLAGRHASGSLPVGAHSGRFDALALHWNVLGEEARVHGKRSDRSNWRSSGPMHCAGTKEQAIADVQYGIEHWIPLLSGVRPFRKWPCSATAPLK